MGKGYSIDGNGIEIKKMEEKQKKAAVMRFEAVGNVVNVAAVKPFYVQYGNRCVAQKLAVLCKKTFI